MVDPKLFTVERLLAALLDLGPWGHHAWRALATIEPHYVAPHAKPDEPSRCVVRVKDSFLRHSKGPMQGHFWDVYGDDYLTPELALIALLEAPVPPFFVKREVWDEVRAQEGAPKP